MAGSGEVKMPSKRRKGLRNKRSKSLQKIRDEELRVKEARKQRQEDREEKKTYQPRTDRPSYREKRPDSINWNNL